MSGRFEFPRFLAWKNRPGFTFLQGYGETLAGSGDPVTPETVFRWASCSKGVAATMVAKLAEQGKIDLNSPVAKRGVPSFTG